MVGRRTRLGRLKLGVAFDEFLGAAAGKTDGEATIVFVTFNADDGTDTVLGMPDFAAKQRIGFNVASSR